MSSPTRIVGRYVLHDEIASGGMATVHYGRLIGPVGFARTVAIKRLHDHYAKDPDFVSMFLDEARIAARIVHPNVVQIHDVVMLENELFLVMDYVHGESLARISRALRRDRERIPLDVVSAIVCGALHGLHAAHEAKSDEGEPLRIVHRDVSPENTLIGADGVARVLDFGVAKAVGRAQTTRDGQVKGKLGYMAIEQLRGGEVDRRTDVYAAGVVLWEALTLERLFLADNEGMTVTNVLERKVQPPGSISPDIPKALDGLVLKALDRNPRRRFDSAREMALALEEIVPVASASRVATWMEGAVGDHLLERSRVVARIEANAGSLETTRQATPESNDAMPSQISSVSVETTPMSVDRARGTRRWLAFAIPAIVLVPIIVTFALRVGRSHEPSTRGQARSPDVSAVAVSSESPATPTAMPVASLVVPEGTSEAPPTPAPTKTVRRRSAVPPAGGPASTKPCVVRPFIDDAGIRNYVRDCK
jgi:serine/threonine-protein kinase